MAMVHEELNMFSESVVISDFPSVIQKQELLAAGCTRDRWEMVRYETADVSGCGLLASPKTLPQPVEIDPGLKGWYKIYLCMADAGGKNGIELKLSNDEFASVVSPGEVWSYIRWNRFEQLDESFWRAADMTGQRITIAKPDNGSSYTASLMWIRFVPMCEEEVQEYLAEFSGKDNKTMYAHMDEDFSHMDLPDYEDVHDYCRQIYHLKNSDVGIVAQEVTNDLHGMADVDPDSYVDRSALGEDLWCGNRMRQLKNLSAKRKEIIEEVIDYTHECGMEFFAVHRMSLSSFAFPYAAAWNRIPFVEEHPELRCVSRDGKNIAFLSYAYEAVRNYMVNAFRPLVAWGVDGVTLLFTRGICVLFEQPVVDRFVEKYGDSIDFRRLPSDDPRVMEIKSDVMTYFMRDLRKALDEESVRLGRKRVKVYIAAYYSPEASKMDGVDVERFAKEDLIDGVIQSNMTVWEETEDVRDEDGLINLKKYTAKAEKEYVVLRSHGNELDRILTGLDSYNRIANETGIRLYSEIQWENTVEPEDFVSYAKSIYEKTVGRIALWDCYPARVCCLPEWYCTSRLGSVEHIRELESRRGAYRKVCKVLSYNGLDISLYHPSWRG